MAGTTSARRIAVIPGDGIGPDVIEIAREVCDAAGTRHGFTLDYQIYDWSCQRYEKTGAMMPDDALDILRGHEAILLGAVGWPGVPDHVSLWGLLIPIRRVFRQFANIRPAKGLSGVDSAVRGAQQMDLVVVRENVEGEYSEIGGRLNRGFPDEMAVQESVFTRVGITRIARHAFALARERRGQLTSATKSNGIVHTMPFWDEVVREVAEDYPDVQWESMHIDALAARVVLDPARFDVILASNLFGDVLSDLTAAVSGSLGVAPSANLDPTGQCPSMFEPVHGSAPDIAGQDVANPAAAVWSAALMLEHLGHSDAAAEVLRAVEASLADPTTRTRDLGGKASTQEAGAAMVDLLGRDSGINHRDL